MTGLQIKEIIVAVVYGLLMGMIVFLITKKLTTNQRRTENIVRKIVGAEAGSTSVLAKKTKGVKLNVRRSESEEEVYVVKKSFVSKVGDALFEQLLAANIMMKPEEFATIWIIATFVPSSLAALFIPNVVVPVLLIVIGLVGPFVYMRAKKSKRTREFEDQLADALLIAASSLTSGLTFQQSMETISRDMYPPISEEFGRAVNECNLGISLDDALENIYQRINSPDFKIVAVAIAVQRTTGGNLSNILNTIADTIKDRASLKREIRSATATGRMSGMVVGMMPVAITLILNMTSPGYMDPMFNRTGGKIALAVGVGLEICGLFVIRNMTTVKY